MSAISSIGLFEGIEAPYNNGMDLTVRNRTVLARKRARPYGLSLTLSLKVAGVRVGRT